MKYSLTTILVSAAIFLTGVSSWADPNPCQITLMSPPACVNLLNASNFCKNAGNSTEVANVVVGCIAKLSQNEKPSIDIIAMCLGSYVRTSRPADNESLCK